MKQAFAVPGVVWIGIILAVIPAVTALLNTYWPEAQYPATAAAVLLLGALAKGLELMLRTEPDNDLADAPTPAATPAPYEPVPSAPWWLALLFGGK